jgi:hypothetical protein
VTGVEKFQVCASLWLQVRAMLWFQVRDFALVLFAGANNHSPLQIKHNEAFTL